MNKFGTLWKSTDKFLVFIPLCFTALSILMICSISHKDGAFLSRDAVTQSAAYLLGFVAMLTIVFINYNAFEERSKPLYIGSLLLLLTVYVPGLGISVHGSRAWVDLGFTTFQPSELVKVSFTILMASYLSKNKDSLRKLKGILSTALFAAPFLLIVVKEDLGSALVFCFVWIFMVFFAGIDYGLFAKFAGLFVVSLPIAYYFMAAYQKHRIDAFLHPDNLELPGNYQVWNSKVAIGSGGVTGKGLFQGTQKELDFLPVQKSDFIFSVIVEELGMIGGAAVILLFAIFLFRMIKVVFSSKDLFGTLLAMGFVGMFLFQIFENIAMTMGMMPVTGITLPFISYGGSSVIANMTAVGLIVSVGIRGKKTGLM